MKPLIYILIPTLLIGITSFFIITNNKEIKIDKVQIQLKELGYNNKEITEIKKLNKLDIDYILKTTYIKNINKLLSNKNFKQNNLKKYVSLINKNLDIEDSIYIVNNNFYDKNITYDNDTINLMKSSYYIHDNLNRYLTYQTNNNLKIKDIIANVNANLDYDFYNHDIKVDHHKGDLILVNKFYKLDTNYVPADLVDIDTKYGKGKIKNDVYEAFKQMYDDANKNNLHLRIISPYRSYNTQASLYNNYVIRDGKAIADTYSARPGYSEHQTGLAIDIVSNTTDLDDFEDTNEFKWMQKNAQNYGFILRYPKDKEYITGYMYESWHYRYVGQETATKIKELGITFEEYYAYFIK